jgi:hypothetical protein
MMTRVELRFVFQVLIRCYDTIHDLIDYQDLESRCGTIRQQRVIGEAIWGSQSVEWNGTVFDAQ